MEDRRFTGATCSLVGAVCVTSETKEVEDELVDETRSDWVPKFRLRKAEPRNSSRTATTSEGLMSTHPGEFCRVPSVRLVVLMACRQNPPDLVRRRRGLVIFAPDFARSWHREVLGNRRSEPRATVSAPTGCRGDPS
jgi:hypothetical protein